MRHSSAALAILGILFAAAGVAFQLAQVSAQLHALDLGPLLVGIGVVFVVSAWLLRWVSPPLPLDRDDE